MLYRHFGPFKYLSCASMLSSLRVKSALSFVVSFFTYIVFWSGPTMLCLPSRATKQWKKICQSISCSAHINKVAFSSVLCSFSKKKYQPVRQLSSWSRCFWRPISQLGLGLPVESCDVLETCRHLGVNNFSCWYED